MPIQIPDLKRFEPQAPESVGRTEVQVTDVSRAFDQQTAAVGRLAEAGVKLIEKVEDDAMDTEALSRANAYELEYREGLEGNSQKGILGLKNLQGDPTKAYNDFDEKMSKRFQELSSADGLSTRARRKIAARLVNAHNQVYGLRLTAYGSQYSKFEHQTTRDSVKLKQTALMEASGMIKVDADGKMSGDDDFKAKIGDIQQVVLRDALKFGSARPNEKGEYAYIDDDGRVIRVEADASVKQQIAEDLSGGVHAAIGNLVASDQVDAAKKLQEDYGRFIEPAKRDDLTKKIMNAEVEQTAYAKLDELSGKTYDQKVEILGKIKNVKIREKALEFLDARERRMKNTVDRASEQAYEQIANYIISVTNDEPSAFQSRSDLNADPTFKRLIGEVKHKKQIEALYQMIEHPKESNVEAEAELLNDLREGRMIGMTPTQLQQKLVGLNKDDRKYFRNWWTKENTETESAERARINSMSTQFLRRAEGLGLFKKNARTGKYSAKDAKYKNELEMRFRQNVERFPRGTSPEQFSQEIEEILREELKSKQQSNKGLLDYLGLRKPFQPPAALAPLPGGEAPAKQAPGAKPKSAFSNMSEAQRIQLMDEFEKVHGREAANNQELMDFKAKQK